MTTGFYRHNAAFLVPPSRRLCLRLLLLLQAARAATSAAVGAGKLLPRVAREQAADIADEQARLERSRDAYRDLLENASAACSPSPGAAVHVPSSLPCPPSCPYSQDVEGIACEKVCLRATQCGDFHPVRFFPHPVTLQCEPPCGAVASERVGGCRECAAPGICKRCSHGLFGLTSLELSEDGRSCYNPGRLWWYAFLVCLAVLALAAGLYVAEVARRPVENPTVLAAALERRERARTELMPRDVALRGFLKANMHREGGAPDWLGGQGVALYFNWLLFAMAVAAILGAGGFYAFELSDLGDQVHSPVACASAPRPEPPVLLRAPPPAPPPGLLALAPAPAPAAAFLGLAAWAPGGASGHATPSESRRGLRRRRAEERHEASRLRTGGDARGVEEGRRGLRERWDAYVERVVQAVRRLWAPMLAAPRTRGMEQKYDQFHSRMFHAAAAMYLLVCLLVFGFSALQLAFVSRRFAGEPNVRQYTAVVSGLPSELVDGRRLTEHIRQAFAREDLGDLWDEFGAPGSGESAPDRQRSGGASLDKDALKDCFHVVGASIAYDFFDHQEPIWREIAAWINDLEGWGHSDEFQQKANVAAAVATTPVGPRANVATSRGTQTETRGEILAALEPALLLAAAAAPVRKGAFFDEVLLRTVGLQEEQPLAFRGSGTAFVVFNTRAARDAAIDMAASRRLAPLRTNRHGRDRWHHLALRPAPCEPVSIQWEHFTTWSHFYHKIALGVLFMFLTIILWFLLYLPYAAFYAELVVIPGLEPSASQDLMLGFLIALGNALLAVVIDKVTGWAGFLYKDARDETVLALAFIFTLVNTVFDLGMVAVVARGAMLEDAFVGQETGYDTAIAREIFSLIVPGYLLVPYLAGPFFERVAPYWLSKILIRTHARVQLRQATLALRCPDFDICWRYSDILNNTTICMALLYFRSSASWKVMVCLLFFVLLIYCIDKYLLLNAATTTIYDTRRLSIAFARWWCVPTGVLAGLVAFWGYKVGAVENLLICFGFPLVHCVLFLMVIRWIEELCPETQDSQLTYREALQSLQRSCRPWDFFNTNPVFCLRSRCLGPDLSGWSEVRDFLTGGKEGGGLAAPPRECVPFSRGSIWLLSNADESDAAAA
eukprot:TRINITY_DN8667_c0_g1_i1.p1 TRINITY_DN8667_c0_g1~~TRINITY_DN8667_c0_g1_i1.p1  ORF type:complete len:1121 (+),score=265.78 TRINITY_DN8667_c0_g1_i1:41-3403(+)